jgi:YgiT-type zinc finger domain-containing protein
MKTKPIKYGSCESCGGVVKERRLTVDRRFRGRLYEFENVPVGVCRECGQRIFKGAVLEELEELAADGSRVKKVLRVPVAEYGPDASRG